MTVPFWGRAVASRPLAAVLLASALAACGDDPTSTPAAPVEQPTVSALMSSPTSVINGIRPRGFGKGTYTLLAPVSGKRTLYVSTSGSDANPGTSDRPFRTINKAAQVATAGDVVTIRNGTYNENVTVRNSGTSSARIVFQAASRGGVILTGPGRAFKPYTYYGGVQNTGQLYVTVRGLIFRGYASNVNGTSGPSFPAALKMARGWKVEDCWFDAAGNTAIQANANDIVITKTTIEKSWIHAITSWAPANSSQSTTDSRYQPNLNMKLTDLIIRGNYTKATSSTASLASYVLKITTSKNLLVDNIESTGNIGPGIWLDARNSYFTVRNSYFHHNKDIPGTVRTGRGINSEINWGPGTIENNIFSYNAGPGLSLTNTAGVIVRKNRFITNQRSIDLTNADRGTTSSGAPLFPTKNLKFFQNEFKDWKDFSGIHTLGGTFTSPSSMGIKADSNVYQPVTVSRLAWWQNIGGVSSISELRSKYGWEHAGRMGTIY